MKYARVTVMAAFFGTMMIVRAQHDGHDEKQGDQREKQGKAEPSKDRQDKGAAQRKQPPPQERQQSRQVQRQDQPQQPAQLRVQPPQQQRVQQQPQQRNQQPPQPQRSDQQARNWQQQRGWLQQKGAWQSHDNWQQDRAQRWSTDHRTWAQRGGYGGYLIPQDRFQINFGSQHFFRLQAQPVIYQGYPRFEYGGFSFLLLDPYPEYWSGNWYAYDDLYIDYDDGYYLYNRAYPQVRLAITVAL